MGTDHVVARRTDIDEPFDAHRAFPIAESFFVPREVRVVPA